MRESKSLLLGEAMSRQAIDDIQRIAGDSPFVIRANRPLCLYFGPEFILVALEVEFSPETGAHELTTALDQVERAIQQKYPKVQRVYIEAAAIGARGVHAA